MHHGWCRQSVRWRPKFLLHDVGVHPRGRRGRRGRKRAHLQLRRWQTYRGQRAGHLGRRVRQQFPIYIQHHLLRVLLHCAPSSCYRRNLRCACPDRVLRGVARRRKSGVSLRRLPHFSFSLARRCSVSSTTGMSYWYWRKISALLCRPIEWEQKIWNLRILWQTLYIPKMRALKL